MKTAELLLQILCLGIGATIMMDMWLLLLKKTQPSKLKFCLTGPLGRLDVSR